MREIKFRAWDKDDNVMKSSRTLRELMVADPIHDQVIDDYVFDQFIGLHDKNGKEIYEGDIYTHGSVDIRYKVIYRGDQFIGNQIGNKSLAGITTWLPRIEVIGNIHENPELLK